MPEPFEIEDIKRLNIQSGDVLLVTVPQHTTMQQAAQIKNIFETQLPVRVIVITSGVTVEIANRELFLKQQVDRLIRMIMDEGAAQ
ncbi:MAG TPA: hypothetical protein VFC19_49290 [Candidatus Limnocylindrales bacterium]|nr:hypothetical protein [Candidatus Limnocylindrales bacterium]